MAGLGAAGYNRRLPPRGSDSSTPAQKLVRCEADVLDALRMIAERSLDPWSGTVVWRPS